MTLHVLLPDGVKGDGEHEAAGEDAQPGLLPVAVHAHQLSLHVPAHRRRPFGIFLMRFRHRIQTRHLIFKERLANLFKREQLLMDSAIQNNFEQNMPHHPVRI
jgi:hypothetical protein